MRMRTPPRPAGTTTARGRTAAPARWNEAGREGGRPRKASLLLRKRGPGSWRRRAWGGLGGWFHRHLRTDVLRCPRRLCPRTGTPDLGDLVGAVEVAGRTA